MASIRIEDLPPGDALTAEAAENTFGAGRQSFVPKHDSLDLFESLGAGFAPRAVPAPAARKASPSPGHIPIHSSASALTFIAFPSAAEVCRTYAARDTTRACLEPGQTPLALLDRLVAEERLYPDALDFLAHALDRRQAIWWGCLCIWLTARSALSVDELRALAGAIAWVVDPSEANRIKALALAAPVADRGAGMLAAAVGASGDSLAKALQLTASLGGADALVASCRRSIGLGIRVAQGHHLIGK